MNNLETRHQHRSLRKWFIKYLFKRLLLLIMVADTVRWWSFNQNCKIHEKDYHGIVVHTLGGHNSLCLKSYKFKIKKIKQMKKFKKFFHYKKKENIETKYYNLFAELAEILQSAESSQYYTRCNNKCFLICSRFFCLLLTRDKNGYCFFNFFFNLINFKFVGFQIKWIMTP